MASMWIMTLLCLVLSGPVFVVSLTSDEVETMFADSLMAEYGKNGNINEDGITEIIEQKGKKEKESDSSPPVCKSDVSLLLQPKCFTKKCLTAKEILELHSMKEPVTPQQLKTITTTVLHTAKNKICAQEEKQKKIEQDPAQVWGYGFLCVTIISVASIFGVVVLPCMSKKYYDAVLMFMISLAVGSLVGNGLVCLLPEALGVEDMADDPRDFVYKCTAVMAGIYLFFLLERFMKIFIHYKERKRIADAGVTDDEKSTVDGQLAKSESTAYIVQNEINDTKGDSVQNGYAEKMNGSVTDVEVAGEKKEKQIIAPVGWMIIVGDMVHNFIDGLAIGAAFSSRVLSGVAVSMAVFCEELPHELGDFAILLTSGMTIRQAVGFNFMSACTCYLGLIVGILLGKTTELKPWIYAIAAGMFFYISLADMMPEVNQAAESEKNKKRIGVWGIFFIQNFGLLFGYFIMMIMAIYNEKIQL